ncbi:MAG: hypothetical protein NC177_03925 [Ruminococcus flavefaciens]|nr:hypothetical protein [Ruminococcus flavefaciens]
MEETEGHPSGEIIYFIIGTHLLIAVYFILLTLSATKLGFCNGRLQAN